MSEKKWRPAHEICIREISGVTLGSYEVEKWASIYAAGAIAPSEAIPMLVKHLAAAGERMKDMIRIPPRIKKAVDNLQAQLEEYEAAQ
jgi:hypothetical protein